MSTRAIIMANGSGDRWAGYRGTTKHLVEIEGESLLGRIVRQVRGAGMEAVISGPYPHMGALAYMPLVEAEMIDGRLATRALWNAGGRTVILMGDVWYSDEAFALIAGFTEREMHLFARFTPSAVTGKPNPEIFANSFWPEHHAQHEATLRWVVENKDTLGFVRAGMWEVYLHDEGILEGAYWQPEGYRQAGHSTVIDDWTDDFDYPEDLDTWLDRRARA